MYRQSLFQSEPWKKLHHSSALNAQTSSNKNLLLIKTNNGENSSLISLSNLTLLERHSKNYWPQELPQPMLMLWFKSDKNLKKNFNFYWKEFKSSTSRNSLFTSSVKSFPNFTKWDSNSQNYWMDKDLMLNPKTQETQRIFQVTILTS